MKFKYDKRDHNLGRQYLKYTVKYLSLSIPIEHIFYVIRKWNDDDVDAIPRENTDKTMDMRGDISLTGSSSGLYIP